MLYMQLFEKTKDLWIMDGMLRLLSLSVSSIYNTDNPTHGTDITSDSQGI